jgi:phage terminase small subunit
MAKHKQKLTPKQAAFCREWVKDYCGAHAAERAGYAKNRSNMAAFGLMRKPHVQAEIARLQKAAVARADVTVDQVVNELRRIAFAQSSDVVRVKRRHVVVTETDMLTDDQRAAVAEVSETDHGIRVKQHDKVKALELLGKYLAMFTDRTELSGDPNAPLVVVQPREPKT